MSASIPVKGTPLQAAIDKAQPGDVLVPSAGGYAGELVVSKPITILSDGGATLYAREQDGPINAIVRAKGAILDGLNFRGGGLSVQFQGDVSGSIVRNFDSDNVRWMVRNTQGGSDDNGGNHFSWKDAIGGIVSDGFYRGGRAPSWDYGFDGGAFEIWQSKGGRAIRVEGWNSVNVTESGKNTGNPDNSDFRFEDCVFHGRRNPLTPPQVIPHPFDATKTVRVIANGGYMRAISGLAFVRCRFDRLDDWAFVFQTGGTFGQGTFAGVTMDDCEFDLLPGVCRIAAVKTGVPISAIAIRNAKVIVNGTTEIAEIFGEKVTTRARLEQLTGWTFAYWGPGPIPSSAQVDPALQAQIDDLTGKLGISASQLAEALNREDGLISRLDTARSGIVTAQQEATDALAALTGSVGATFTSLRTKAGV